MSRRRDRGITRDRYGWRVVVSLTADPVTGRRRQVERHRRTLPEARAVMAELRRRHAHELAQRVPRRVRSAEPGPVGYRGPRLPLDPVREHVSMVALARALDVCPAMLYRWQRHGGVSIDLADRIAVEVLGRHPVDVWGSDWWAVA